MVGINPGILRESVAFQTLNRVSDGAGGTTATPTTVFTLSASVVPGKAARSLEQGRLRLATPYTVTIRRNVDQYPKVDMLTLWRGETYQILEIQDTDPYRRFVQVAIVKAP